MHRHGNKNRDHNSNSMEASKRKKKQRREKSRSPVPQRFLSSFLPTWPSFLTKRFAKNLTWILFIAAGCGYFYYGYQELFGIGISDSLLKVSAQLGRYLKMKEEFIQKYQNDPLDKFIKEQLVPIQSRVASLRTQISQHEALLKKHKNSGSPSNFVATTKAELTQMSNKFMEIEEHIQPILWQRLEAIQQFKKYRDHVLSYDKEFDKLAMKTVQNPWFIREELFFTTSTPEAIEYEKRFKDEDNLEKIGAVTKEVIQSLVSLSKVYGQKEKLEKEIVNTYWDNSRPDEEGWELWFFNNILEPIAKISSVGPGLDRLLTRLEKTPFLNEAKLMLKYKALKLLVEAKVNAERTKVENVMGVMQKLSKMMLKLVMDNSAKFEKEFSFQQLKKEVLYDVVNLFQRVQKME